MNDDVTSLCIDAGDPTVGVAFETQPHGDRINQGFYGGTEKASKSPWGPEPYCSNYPTSDANLDCRVDLADMSMMTREWLECNLVPAEACDM